MEGLLRILALTLEVFVKSAPYLLVGFLLAGVVHVLLKGRSFGKNLTTRGLRSIFSAMGFGVVLPVCSCGVLPLALTLKKRKATPEAAAAFVVATPDNSEDTVLLTAGLLGPLFAAVRVVAGFVAGLLSGLLVLASEAWGEPERAGDGRDGDANGERCECPRSEPRWFRALSLALLWAPRRLGERIARTRGTVPPAEAGAPAPRGLGERFVAGIAEAVSFGFREVLDEIAWPLLAGLVLSGFLSAALPEEALTRIPGGLAGQMLFAAVIAVPLYLCASASTPLGAVLLAKGLSPAALLVLFLTGPVTNVPTVLLVRRHFGRRFLVALLLGTFAASAGIGLLLEMAWKRTGPAGLDVVAALEEAPSALDLAAALVFAVPFLGALLRVGAREGLAQVASTVRGLVPSAATARLKAVVSAAARMSGRAAATAVVVLAAAAWLGSGFAAVPVGSLGFARTLGRVDPEPLGPGWRWHLPPPVGGVDVFPSSQLLKLDLGFRTSGLPDPDAVDWAMAAGSWHASYTTPGDNPEEASFVTGDQNLIEVKVALHLAVSRPYELHFLTRGGAEAARPVTLSVLRRLLARRPIDGVLTRERGALEAEAKLLLQAELQRAALPLTVVSLNVLDLHPPLGAVAAFRDVGSAAEDRERRVYEARAVAESTLPRARGLAEAQKAAAAAQAAERTSEARGRLAAFAEQAAAARAAPLETRVRLRWEALERSLSGRRTVVAPRSLLHDLVDAPATDASTLPGPKR